LVESESVELGLPRRKVLGTGEFGPLDDVETFPRRPNGRRHTHTLLLVGAQEGDADVDGSGLLFGENHEVGWGEEECQ
jgi:hypothetical protein